MAGDVASAEEVGALAAEEEEDEALAAAAEEEEEEDEALAEEEAGLVAVADGASAGVVAWAEVRVVLAEVRAVIAVEQAVLAEGRVALAGEPVASVVNAVQAVQAVLAVAHSELRAAVRRDSVVENAAVPAAATWAIAGSAAVKAWEAIAFRPRVGANSVDSWDCLRTTGCTDWAAAGRQVVTTSM